MPSSRAASPAHTVSLFAALKSGQEEPKVEVAAAVERPRDERRGAAAGALGADGSRLRGAPGARGLCGGTVPSSGLDVSP